jgi:hypothetical protein
MIGLRNRLAIGDEAVAPAAYSFDVPGAASRVVECAAELVHAAADVVIEIDKGAIRPDALAQFFARYQFAGLLQESQKQAKGTLLDLHADAVLAELSGSSVDHKRAELKLRNGNWTSRVRHIVIDEFVLGKSSDGQGQKSTTETQGNEK